MADKNIWGVVSLLLLVSLTRQTLTVYNYASLKADNKVLLDIPYSIANFGFVPFGKTMISNLMISPNFSTECLPDNSTANYQNSFMLIPRGQCPFVQKVINAQMEGAELAIIMDNEKEYNKEIIMKDDGYGYKVRIPSVFIHYEDGEALKKLAAESNSNVVMKITFENKKTTIVDMVLWLEANNRRSYKLVTDFQEYYQLIQKYVNLTLVYNVAGCSYCLKEDCYFELAYCAWHIIHEDSANGQMILDQQIREQVIFQVAPTKWWSYMKEIGDQCSAISELQLCSRKAMKKLEINETLVQQKFTKSFSTWKDNTYLKANLEKVTPSGYRSFPGITLNGVKMKASLNPEFIFDDICNTLTNPPPECSKYVEETHVEASVTNAWEIILLVVVVGFLVFSLIFCVYRRYMKRKIIGEMQSRVDDMVSKYIEFYSDRNKPQ